MKKRRNKKLIAIRLYPEDLEKLDQLKLGSGGRTAVIEYLIRQAVVKKIEVPSMPEPVDCFHPASYRVGTLKRFRCGRCGTWVKRE